MTAVIETYMVREGLPADVADRQFIADAVEIASGMDEYHEDAARTLKRAMDHEIVHIDPEHLVDAAQFLLEDLGFDVDWKDTGYVITKEA